MKKVKVVDLAYVEYDTNRRLIIEGSFGMSRKKCRRSCGVGGQAVLEGVMMKKGDLYAVTVRKPDGELVIDTEEFHGVMHGSKIKNVPFIRGIFNFVDSLILGTRTLTYSADFVEDETAKAIFNFYTTNIAIYF